MLTTTHLKKISNTNDIVIDRRNSLDIAPHEYAVTNKGAERHILATHSASPCIILAMYCEKSSTTILAHIDAVTNVSDAIKQMLIYFDNPLVIKAYLSGGSKNSPGIVGDTVERLQDNNIANISDCGLFKTDKLLIDAKTGCISNSFDEYFLGDDNSNTRSISQEKYNDPILILKKDLRNNSISKGKKGDELAKTYKLSLSRLQAKDTKGNRESMHEVLDTARLIGHPQYSKWDKQHTMWRKSHNSVVLEDKSLNHTKDNSKKSFYKCCTS